MNPQMSSYVSSNAALHVKGAGYKRKQYVSNTNSSAFCLPLVKSRAHVSFFGQLSPNANGGYSAGAAHVLPPTYIGN